VAACKEGGEGRCVHKSVTASGLPRRRTGGVAS